MKKSNLTGGIILIFIGLALFLSNFNLLGEINILIFIGAAFLVVYILSGRNLGFLIPGLIVLSIGLFAYFTENQIMPEDDGEVFLIFLAGAFWLIMFIHTAWIKNASWGERYWPVFPAGILSILGTMLIGDKYSHDNIIGIIATYLWPVLLIILGIVVMIPRDKKDIHKE